jgi:hypothetical protein
VSSFGATGYGSAAGTMGRGVRAVALAADPDTGGYWILKSNGGVGAYVTVVDANGARAWSNPIWS